MLHRLRPSRAVHRQDRSADGGVERARAAAAEPAWRERRQARELITAARAAARKWATSRWPRTPSSPSPRRCARPKTSAAQRAVLEQINWETAAPLVSRSTEAAGLRGRRLAERKAAADERHRQALGDWSALPRGRRWMSGTPKRESPDPPSRQEVAAARDELVGVVRAAMMTELEKVVPQPRPAVNGRSIFPRCGHRKFPTPC